MKAILRRVRISPKKANLIAALVRGEKALNAIDILKFTPKKAAPVLKKLIESAIANAENNFKQEKENLYIQEIIVNEGVTYKRSVPISRGRVHPLLKRTSNITVKLNAAKAKANTIEKQAKKVSQQTEQKQAEEPKAEKTKKDDTPKKTTKPKNKKAN